MDPHSALHEAGGPRDFPPEQRFSFLSLPSILFPSLPFHFLSFSFLTYLTFPFLPFLPFIPVFSILHSCLSAFLTLDDDIWAKQAKQHENPNVSKAKLPMVHVTNMKKNFAPRKKKGRLRWYLVTKHFTMQTHMVPHGHSTKGWLFPRRDDLTQRPSTMEYHPVPGRSRQGSHCASTDCDVPLVSRQLSWHPTCETNLVWLSSPQVWFTIFHPCSVDGW